MSNGKGSKQRPTNLKEYCQNYDDIFRKNNDDIFRKKVKKRLLTVNRIEYTKDTQCSYVYFWPQDCDFIFDLSSVNMEKNIKVDYKSDDGEIFGVEILYTPKEKVIETLKKALKKEAPDYHLQCNCSFEEY